MNEQNGQSGQGEKKEKKSENTISPLAVVALLLLTLSESGETALVTILFSALMVGAIVYVVYKGISKYVKNRKETEGEGPAALQADAAPGEPAFEAGSEAADDPEDPFAREREQRMKQLDDWLKNGTIDREEYQQLKDRYEGEQ